MADMQVYSGPQSRRTPTAAPADKWPVPVAPLIGRSASGKVILIDGQQRIKALTVAVKGIGRENRPPS